MDTLLESDCAYIHTCVLTTHKTLQGCALCRSNACVPNLRCAHARNKTLIFGLPSVSVYPLSGTRSVWLCFSGSVKTVLETWEEFMGNFPMAFNEL